MGVLLGWLLHWGHPLLHLPKGSMRHFLLHHHNLECEGEMDENVQPSRIIANESMMEIDSSTYLACFDSGSFHIGINTLHSNPHRQQEPFAGPATIQWKNHDRHFRRVRDHQWKNLCLQNWGWHGPSWYHQNPLHARSEVTSSVSPALGRDSQEQLPHQIWGEN